jgi:hypothetical protein
MDLREMERGGGNWFAVAQDRDRWWNVVNEVIKFRVL